MGDMRQAPTGGVGAAALANTKLPLVVGGEGSYYHTADRRKILDACGGAAVACLGHGHRAVVDAVAAQAGKIAYAPYTMFDNQAKLELERLLCESSGGHFAKAYFVSSGSEAVEGALKLAREYFVWKGEPERVNFIARDESYHGMTLGALGLGGHLARRAPFEPLLQKPLVHRVPACNPYRQRASSSESDAAFVARKAAELDAAFKAAGPHSVAAFCAEPVVGAASGCTPNVPGYFGALKKVCDEHGALLVFDEVMCGMGRTGTTHAWQWEQDNVKPDIQTVGKALGGGYQPISAILASKKIVGMMEDKGVEFTHGHTYQDHPIACAAALKVQQIIASQNLLSNVRAQGAHLEALLRAALGGRAYVGDIRGRGLFWGVEFVADRATGRAFSPALQVARRVHKVGMMPAAGGPGGGGHDIALYYGQGCAGGGKGDHVMIMPAYNVTREVVEEIVRRFVAIVDVVFRDDDVVKELSSSS